MKVFQTIKNRISYKFRQYQNFRLAEGIFQDFLEQEFTKDAESIYEELKTGVNMKLHYIITRTLHPNYYYVRLFEIIISYIINIIPW